LKIYNTLVLPTFLYGSENWTLTALQRRRIEAAEMKLLRPLAGFTLYEHKTNDYIRRELRITGILDMLDEYRGNWLSHLQRMTQNLIPLKSDHKEGEQLEDRRSVGASSCNSGDGTDQRVQSLMFMMMMTMKTNDIYLLQLCFHQLAVVGRLVKSRKRQQKRRKNTQKNKSSTKSQNTHN